MTQWSSDPVIQWFSDSSRSGPGHTSSSKTAVPVAQRLVSVIKKCSSVAISSPWPRAGSHLHSPWVSYSQSGLTQIGKSPIGTYIHSKALSPAQDALKTTLVTRPSLLAKEGPSQLLPYTRIIYPTYFGQIYTCRLFRRGGIPFAQKLQRISGLQESFSTAGPKWSLYQAELIAPLREHSERKGY